MRVVVLVLVVVAGCATVREERAVGREEMLVRSGFQKKVATTDAQRGQIQTLPQGKLVRVPLGTDVRYVFADAETCQCLFVGTQEATEAFITALTYEFINNDYRDTATPQPTLSAAQTAMYEKLAKQAVLDPPVDATLDWTAWD